MLNPAQTFSDACLLFGRFLLGLYFIGPGIMKITDFEGTSAYMASAGAPLIPVLLTMTILIQVGCGAMLIVGFKGRVAAFLLAGLTFMISIYMHGFWVMEEGVSKAHETQNFVKNMAVMAGLLITAGLGTGRFSLDGRRRENDGWAD
mgnify:FL=1